MLSLFLEFFFKWVDLKVWPTFLVMAYALYMLMYAWIDILSAKVYFLVNSLDSIYKWTPNTIWSCDLTRKKNNGKGFGVKTGGICVHCPFRRPKKERIKTKNWNMMIIIYSTWMDHCDKKFVMGD